MARVAVILHERLGTWAGQLRNRLVDRPVRWFETRSTADLDAAIVGVASPVVVIDLSRNVAAVRDLDHLARVAPGARILVLDPEAHEALAAIARELGATEVISGFVPPPEVAQRIDRWIRLASEQIDREGWSRPLAGDLPADPEGWLETILSEQAELTRAHRPG